MAAAQELSRFRRTMAITRTATPNLPIGFIEF
jgi:hypothetical protein